MRVGIDRERGRVGEMILIDWSRCWNVVFISKVGRGWLVGEGRVFRVIFCVWGVVLFL